MGRVDTTFAPIPASLLNDWGQSITYVKAGTDTYNASTGTVTSTETNISMKGLITLATPEEFEGVYQTNDLKIIIGNAELGAAYPSVRDIVQYTENGVTKAGRIIRSKTYRGDAPVMHVLLVRPQ